MKYFLLWAFLWFTISGFSQTPLHKTWHLLLKNLPDRSFVNIEFHEKQMSLEHTRIPLEPLENAIVGKLQYNLNQFSLIDSIFQKYYSHSYSTKTVLGDGTLLYFDSDENKLSALDSSDYYTYLISSARYTPFILLNYCLKKNLLHKSSSPYYTIYDGIVENSQIRFLVHKKTGFIDQIISNKFDDKDDEYYGFGDTKATYFYSNYLRSNEIPYPTKITIQKLNGFLVDTVTIDKFYFNSSPNKVLIAPKDYSIKSYKPIKNEVLTSRIGTNLYSVTFIESQTKSMLVNFKDYLLVIDAPLNSENGELLWKEIRKIFPSKPVQYFSFGHFHPHYSGGIRPFICRGSKILCQKEDQDYIRFISNCPYSLKPDSLYKYPKVIKFQDSKESLILKDSINEVRIYHMGALSNHTNDYSLFYFPKQKMLFEDDLISIRNQELNARGKSLVEYINSKQLEVTSIIQGWPTSKDNDQTYLWKDLLALPK